MGEIREPVPTSIEAAMARRLVAERFAGAAVVHVEDLHAVLVEAQRAGEARGAFDADDMGEAHCRVCGCSEYRACVVDDQPCGWADSSRTLCTACAPYLEGAR